MDISFQTGIPAAASADGDTAPLAQWEQLARRGRMYARTGQAPRAVACHQRALLLAQTLVASPLAAEEPHACLAALVVSHHNLADLHRDAGHLPLAVQHVCAAHDALVTLACDLALDPHLQAAAMRHLRETHAALVTHVQDYGPHLAITESLARTAMLFCAPSGTWH